MVRLQYKRYSLDVELKFLHYPHDCKALLLDGGVVPLCHCQFLAAVAHRVGLPVVNLHQHCAYSIIRRISPKDESPLGVGQSQDGSSGQQSSHGLERALLRFLPLHCVGLSLLQQVRQCHCYSCEVGDIFPVVVGKSHECADLFLGGRSGCFHDLPHVVVVQPFTPLLSRCPMKSTLSVPKIHLLGRMVRSAFFSRWNSSLNVLT